MSESRKIQQLHSSSDFAESEVSDCDSAYNIPVNTIKPKIPKLKIKKLKSGQIKGKKKYNEDQIGQISDIEEAYEELDVAELKEDTLNNLFVLLEMVPQNDDLD